jgi:phosphoribosylformylglycinamidine synthase subunit PurL
VTKAVPSGFQRAGDDVYLITPAPVASVEQRAQEFGSSEFARVAGRKVWGSPPSIDIQIEANLHRVLAKLAEAGLLHSACDVADGGMAVALVKASFEKGLGIEAGQQRATNDTGAVTYFGELASQVVISSPQGSFEKIRSIVESGSSLIVEILDLKLDGQTIVAGPVEEFQQAFATALELQLSEEVTA